jgi:O-antigen/teichoic acid export membrane protein
VEIDVHDATPEETASYARQSPGGLIRRALAQASAYTVGGVGVRAAEFLLLPLYWALLPPSQYGVLAVAAIVSEFLRAVFGFGLPEAIARFWHDWSPEERERRVGAIWTGAWVGSALLAGVLLALGPVLTRPLINQVAFSPYLELAILAALASSMVQVPLMLLRMMERPATYVAGTAAATLLGAALAIWLVAVEGRGARGVLEAQVIAPAVVAVAYAVLLGRWARPAFDRDTLGGLLAFALPLVPSKLLEAAATVVDRFVLEKHLTLEALGIYHAARQVGRGVELLGFSLLTAWIPFQMRVLAERAEDGRRLIARAAPWFLLIILAASVAVALLGPPAIRLLGFGGYEGVPPLIPLAVLASAVLSLAHVLIQGYIIARKTQYAWLRSGTRLIVVVAAMLALVPIAGLPGAFLALALSALAQGVVGYALAQRFFPIPFPWGTIALMTAGAVASVGMVALLPALAPAPALLLGLAVACAYALCMAWVARATTVTVD